jgi:hypothetical protein
MSSKREKDSKSGPERSVEEFEMLEEGKGESP